MLDDRRYVITGMSRLAVRVARLLGDRGAEAIVITDDDSLVPLLPDAIKVVSGDGPWVDRLRAIDLPGSDCLLALAEDDLENLRVTTAASATDGLRPATEIVVAGPEDVLRRCLSG